MMKDLREALKRGQEKDFTENFLDRYYRENGD